MAYYKYELMLKYLGIKASILNPRAESIFDNEFGYQGFYMRYMNLDTNQEELAKVYVDTQRQNYKEFREIYKAADDEKSKTLKASLAAKFNIKQKDIFIYASYPVEVINEEISNLRNFRVSETPDKYYWDVSNFKSLPGMLDFLEVNPDDIKGFENDINYIIFFKSIYIYCSFFQTTHATPSHLSVQLSFYSNHYNLAYSLYYKNLCRTLMLVSIPPFHRRP